MKYNPKVLLPRSNLTGAGIRKIVLQLLHFPKLKSMPNKYFIRKIKYEK